MAIIRVPVPMRGLTEWEKVGRWGRYLHLLLVGMEVMVSAGVIGAMDNRVRRGWMGHLGYLNDARGDQDYKKAARGAVVFAHR